MDEPLGMLCLGQSNNMGQILLLEPLGEVPHQCGSLFKSTLRNLVPIP